jgi:hypothetical protein
MKTNAKLWIGIGVLAFFSPIGLYLPSKLNAGSAWGEWSAEELKKLHGVIPVGLNKMASLWHAVMPGYSLGGRDKGLGHSSIAYIIAAIAGIGLCAAIAYILGKLLARKNH